MSSEEVNFHINHMVYTINVDDDLKREITKHLDPVKSNDTKDLLAAYIRITQEFAQYKKDLQEISNKLEKY